MNHSVPRHATSARVQTGRSDTIEPLTEMIIQLLRVFYLNTQRKPEQVLFYRDAVLSESRYVQVMHNELELVREDFDTLEQGYSPRITFTNVQKQHHVRLFPTNSQSSDRSGNCPPGAVVDTETVHPFGSDFCKYIKIIYIFFFIFIKTNIHILTTTTTTTTTTKFFIYLQTFNLMLKQKERLDQHIIMCYMMRITFQQMDYRN